MDVTMFQMDFGVLTVLYQGDSCPAGGQRRAKRL